MYTHISTLLELAVLLNKTAPAGKGETMTPLPLLTYVLDTAMTEMVDVWLEGIDADTHQVEIGYCIEPYWEDYRAHIIRTYMDKEYKDE